MNHRRHQHTVGQPIAGQLGSDDLPRHVSQTLEQLAEEPLGSSCVATRLDQDVEHVAVLVDRATGNQWCR